MGARNVVGGISGKQTLSIDTPQRKVDAVSGCVF
jgi:hypothetical protein